MSSEMILILSNLRASSAKKYFFDGFASCDSSQEKWPTLPGFFKRKLEIWNILLEK